MLQAFVQYCVRRKANNISVILQYHCFLSLGFSCYFYVTTYILRFFFMHIKMGMYSIVCQKSFRTDRNLKIALIYGLSTSSSPFSSSKLISFLTITFRINLIIYLISQYSQVLLAHLTLLLWWSYNSRKYDFMGSINPKNFDV